MCEWSVKMCVFLQGDQGEPCDRQLRRRPSFCIAACFVGLIYPGFVPGFASAIIYG